MFRNYLLVAFRNIQRNAVYSFINISGLAIGIACSLLIILWVRDELSFDRFHVNADNLHQVWINATYDGQVNSWNSVPLPTAEALREADSNIIHAVTCDWGSEHLLAADETRFNKTGIYATEEYLETFRFPMVKGSPETSLDDPYSIVLTESTAKALFGDEDPINKFVRIDNTDDLKVTGIIRDVPSNSTFQFDYLIPFRYFENQAWVKSSKENWGNYAFQVFVELHPSAVEENVEANIRDILSKNGQTDIKREFFLHPIKRWRLHSNFKDGREAGGMIDYVNMFSMIAGFILLIACINFMNLATARSERRAREVGIRKSIGSKRKDLIVQFIGESLMISCFAFAVALLITELSLPLYNELVDKRLSLDYSSAEFWLIAIAITGLTGVVAGSYPAFYLSSFNVVRVLKGALHVGRGATTPRKVLVVVQFVFSIVLIVCSIVVQRQIAHVKDRHLGYDQENLVMVDYTAELGKNYKSLKNELLASGLVEAVTKSNSPVTAIYSNNFMNWPGKAEDQRVLFTTIATEYDYSRTLGMKMLEGRDFSKEFPSDTSAIIINKAALDIMGLEDPVGTTVEVWGNKRHIIGVADNVLMGSLFRNVSPAFIVLIPDWASTITMRLKETDDLQASLKGIEAIFRKFNPAYPFEYSFVDVEFNKKFSTINMMSRLGGIFTLLAICITGLGLFGLAAFTAEQRTKEVGIRKVLGASVTNLVLLISREFTLLVVIAFAISTPIAWWGSGLLLERYPYRIEFPMWVLPVSGILSLAFALFIVSTQAFKAANANPVKSLRSE